MKTTPTHALALATTLVAFVTSQMPAHAKTIFLPEDKPTVDAPAKPVVDGQNKIQIALLLDTSSSMNGLIDQAKTQLWKVVNTFIDAERGGQKPFVEVALYEYGNNGNAAGNDWIRLVSPLTRDLDDLSGKLFALQTNGGEEYCGAVIQRALGDLAWDDNKKTYKAIFIAGNEPFTQGRVDARSVSKEALAKGIIINTIHCGSRQDGISGAWHDGAALGGGDFLVIDQDKVVAHIDAPQDKRIVELSSKLNETYIGWGAHRDEAARMQLKADVDAIANDERGAHVQRAVTKSSQNYSNSGWDLCDAVKDKKVDITKLKNEELPENLRGKSVQELNKLVADATAKREQIQKEIQTLSKEREAHIADALKKQADSGDKSLDQAMIEATRNQASKVGYSFKN
jgi:hypothetical protein